MKFGELVRTIRIRNRLGLREFCIQHQHDPSNWSKVERGVLPPPDDESLLQDWASQLGIKKGSRDWFAFFDAAALERNRIPQDIRSDEELMKKVPAFFRTLRGQKPSSEELEDLWNLLQKHNQP